MPCAASPPSAFCHENVTTSSLPQSSLCANAAEVASQIVKPARSALIQSALATRAPEVVPFQVNTTSDAGSTLERSGNCPYGAFSTVTSLSLSSFWTSLTQPSPNDSQASMVTGRGPSSDHSARSMARLSFALPILDRCERPRTASVRAWRLQPGRLAQGPDEKCGMTGRTPGLVFAMCLSFQIGAP